MICKNCESYKQIIANKDELIMKMQKDLEQIRDLANPHIYYKKECRYHQDYGPRKGCEQYFIPKTTRGQFCSNNGTCKAAWHQKKERSKSRMCLHYQEYGIRKNCKKLFVPNRMDKMHCSDGCRDTYNAKQRKMEDGR